jgi:hypothetical protein
MSHSSRREVINIGLCLMNKTINAKTSLLTIITYTKRKLNYYKLFNMSNNVDQNVKNFNNNMSTAVVFLDIEKAFETWHLGLLYKLSTLQFSMSLIKLISSFLFSEKIRSFSRR